MKDESRPEREPAGSSPMRIAARVVAAAVIAILLIIVMTLAKHF
jgi:hypothetical protein